MSHILYLVGQRDADQTSTIIRRELLTISVILKREHAIRKIDVTWKVRNSEECVSGTGCGEC